MLVFRGGGLLHLKEFILEGFWQNFLAWSAFFLFLVIPVIALLTWLIRRISGTRSRSHYLGYTFATLWVIGLFSMIVLGGMIMNNFRSRQHVEEAVSLTQPSQGKLIVQNIRPINRYEDTDWWFDVDMGRNSPFYNLGEDSVLLTTVSVKVLKSDDSAFHVNLIKFSRGSSGPLAHEMASGIQFPVSQADSILKLPQGFAIPRGEKFRNQQVRVEISVPVGKHILIARSVEDYHWFNVNPGRTHINFGSHGRDWDNDWDEEVDDANTYSWTSNVDYVMTSTGLVRSDRRTKYDHRNNQQQKGDEDDDQQEYKDNKDDKDSKPAKPDNGGYRYKGPGSQPKQRTDTTSPVIKKTAMRTKPEDCTFCAISLLERV